MARLHVVELPALNLLPEDLVTMSFATTPMAAESLANDALARTEIAEFFTTVKGAMTQTLGSLLSSTRSRTASICKIKTYDLTGHLDGSPHGSPLASSSFSLDPAGAAANLPDEVAVCVTLEGEGRALAAVEAPDGADPGAEIDRPKQRRTGRIYFGPLITSGATVTEVSEVPRPAAALTTNLRIAIDQLTKDLASSAGYILGVWSRRDATVYDIEAVSTDDAFDIQRRRGPSPTARTRSVLPMA